MNVNRNKMYYIPPAWGVALLFLFCAIVIALLEIFDIHSDLAAYAYFHIPGIILSSILSILATRSYSFYANRLEVCVLGMPVKRVYWKDVSGAMYADYITKSRRANTNGPFLIICIWPCQAEEILPDQCEKFFWKNFRHLIEIPIAEKSTEVLAVMEQLGINVFHCAEDQ